MVQIYVWIIDKYSSNSNLQYNFSSYNFMLLFSPTIQLKSSLQPLISLKFECHQKGIEPESEREKHKLKCLSLSFKVFV